MNDREIHQLLKRIRTVIHHVGTFEDSFPRVLKKAPVYTRSHLIVFYEILPDLIRLLEFSSETIPAIGKISNLETNEKSDETKTSEHLDMVHDRLGELMRGFGIEMEADNRTANNGMPHAEVAVDRDTVFGREGGKDNLVADEIASEDGNVSTPNVVDVESIRGDDQEASNDAITDVDDIDALLNSEENDEDDEINDQSDIDALVASAQNGTSEPPEGDGDLDVGSTLDDIDALLDQ